MSRLRRSLIIVFFSSNGATAVNFIVSIILARLLSPDDIGIFSITVVVTNIAHIFRDFGVTSYLKTVKNLTPETIRAANGVLMASSWCMGLFLFLLSGWVADYYQQPGIYDVMRVLSIGFLFIPFGAITLALLVRELNAEATTWINVGGVSAYAISAITLAYLDFGFMSMAWANLINIIATALACAPFRPKYAPWLPSAKGWRRVVHFGTGAILGNTVGAINTALPDVVLGKMSGPYDVGILSRANSTTNIFTQIAGPTVNYAAMPHLAQIHHSGQSLAPALNKGVSYLTGIAWPALFATAVFSSEIIRVLYGEKWLDCVPIVQILCLMGAMNMIVNFNGAALTAIGRPYLASVPDIALFMFRILCIWLIYDGNLSSFAWALVMASVLTYPVHMVLQSRSLGIHITTVPATLWASSIVSVGCGSLAITLKLLLPADFNPWLTIAVAAIAITPTWVFLLKLTHHGVHKELLTMTARLRSR